MHGLLHARGDRVVIMDADLSHHARAYLREGTAERRASLAPAVVSHSPSSSRDSWPRWTRAGWTW